MNILYIWDADYPWDIRVEKICNSLKSAGHEVHIASRNLKYNSIYEENKGLHIHRMKSWKNNFINYAFSFPVFFNPFWKKFLDSIIKRHSIKLIIVRDLPMSVYGICAGKRYNLPVILDMAENYVAMIHDIWRSRKFQGLNLIVRNPYLAKMVEHYALPRFDHIFVVVEEAKSVAIRAGAKHDKITIVGNTPQLTESFNMVHCDDYFLPKELSNLKNPYLVIYTGGIQLGRGLQIVFDAIPEITKTIPEFIFVIIGDGYAIKQLKIMAEKKISLNLFVGSVG